MHYCKLKLNTCQHGLLKSKSIVTNSVKYSGYISVFINYRHRAHAIHFYLSSAFDLVQHFVLLEKTWHFLAFLMVSPAGSAAT